MKLLPDNSSRQPPVWAAAARAFTLVEMMTTMAIFSMVVLAMVSFQIFGLKMNAFVSSKLTITADALKALDQIRNQIREATNAVLIGNFNVVGNTFTPIANGSSQIGNAMQISNNSADYVTFYVSTNAFGLTGGNLFKQNTNSQPMVLTHSNVINQLAFQAEDYQGNTNVAGSSAHSTIHMTLQFRKLDYSAPIVTYDYYQLESRATPREQF
jgi:prepilin-type N-terminal cleavage/methylation domain-containing protein